MTHKHPISATRRGGSLKKSKQWLFGMMMFVAGGSGMAAPPPAESTAYDPAYQSIKPVDLRRAIVRASKNSPVTMFQTLRQADQQDLNDEAIRILEELRRQQPNNALILSAYCLAIENALGWGVAREHRRARTSLNEDMALLSVLLSQSKQLDPELWLTYAVEGRLMFYGLPERYEKGLPLFQKAVQLAPEVPFARYWLGDAYVCCAASVWSQKERRMLLFRKAAEQLEKAVTLKPVVAQASYELFQLYDFWLPDKAKAQRAGRLLVASMPPGNKESPPRATEYFKGV